MALETRKTLDDVVLEILKKSNVWLPIYFLCFNEKGELRG